MTAKRPFPPLGRRGFRTPREVLADLAAVAGARPPTNEVRITVRDPVNPDGEFPEGVLTLDRSDASTMLIIDGRKVFEVVDKELRGAWLSFGEEDYWLKIDIGPRRWFQINLPLDPAYRHPPPDQR